MRHRPLGPVEAERVERQSFEDDLLLLRQDSSSFEYWGGVQTCLMKLVALTSGLDLNRIL